ncbi:MAG: tetratricopeptide repeat protein [Chloroflexi bacterium]|nr:tetratricopeptide repeat protein [Chloroflexota bacterium]
MTAGNESNTRFADLLRDFRLVAGLTQEELAERAGLSQRGVSDLERGTRRNPYPATVRRLAAAMQLSPEDQLALEVAGQGPRGPARRSLRTESVTSSPTSFIGRERELAHVRALLASNRLVTVTGTGGIGKTRLALAVAAQTIPKLVDHVTVVELAGLSVSDLVPRVLATRLGLRDDPSVTLVETIIAAIGRTAMLLVLDNCEHVSSGCTPIVEAVLDGCPRARILATSRGPLGVDGEVRWSIPPMRSDAAGNASLDRLGRYDAVQLFVARARAVWPTFALSSQTAPAVSRICRRLEGIPLAIELAAARTRVLSFDQLDARLENRFGVLVMGPPHADPRHRTLRTALDWSYELLSEDEQRLFDRLSVFRGGAVLEAIEAVGASPQSATPVADLVQSLVEQSLITADLQPDGTIRFHQLETVREYAALLLEQHNGLEQTRDRHLKYFTELCDQAQATWRTPDEQFWFERIEHEHDNVRAALDWARQRLELIEVGLRLAAAMEHFWGVRGYAVEGRRWLEDLLAAPIAVQAAVRGAALYAAAHLAFDSGDYACSTTWCREALAVRRKLGDMSGIGMSLNQLAILAASQGRFEEAHADFQESLAISRAAGDQNTVAAALVNLAMTARHLARFDEARMLLGQSLELFRTLGSRTAENRALHALGNLAVDEHDATAAHAWFRQALVLSVDLRDMSSVARCLESVASLEVEGGDGVQAATLYAAAEALRQSIGVPATAVSRPARAERIAKLECRLGHKRFLAAWNHGLGMSTDRAIQRALS